MSLHNHMAAKVPDYLPQNLFSLDNIMDFSNPSLISPNTIPSNDTNSPVNSASSSNRNSNSSVASSATSNSDGSQSPSPVPDSSSPSLPSHEGSTGTDDNRSGDFETATSQSNERPRKHIQRACLECRKRHIRCDGVTPVCKKCNDTGRTCSYIPSHRGGARVSQRKLKLKQKLEQSKERPHTHPPQDQRMLAMPANPSKTWTGAPLEDPPGPDFCVEAFGTLRYTESIPALSFAQPNGTPNSSALSPKLPQPLPIYEILDIYYTQFHYRHPFLPPREHIETYIAVSPDLIAVLTLIAHVLKSPRLMDRGDIEYLVLDAREKINDSETDLIKLQSTVLLSNISYMCGMPSVYQQMKTWSSDICFSGLQMCKPSDTSCRGAEILRSTRTDSLDKKVYMQSLAKVAHEAFFIDASFSIISSQPFSNFVSDTACIDLVPVEDEPHFAYKTRFRTVKMVQGIVACLDSFKSGTANADFRRLEKLVAMFEQMLDESMSSIESDDCSNTQDAIPKLVDADGILNEGIHQSIVTLYFSIILLHFPLSCIAAPTPACPGRIAQDTFEATLPLLPRISKRTKALDAFLQYRTSSLKSLRAAKVITSLLSRLGPETNYVRAPIFSCCLVTASAIQLRGVSFMKSMLHRKDYEEEELEEAIRHVKLSLEVLGQYGQKWRKAKELEAVFIRAVRMELGDSIFAKKEDPMQDTTCLSACDLTNGLSMELDFDQFKVPPVVDWPPSPVDFERFNQAELDKFDKSSEVENLSMRDIVNLLS